MEVLAIIMGFVAGFVAGVLYMILMDRASDDGDGEDF